MGKLTEKLLQEFWDGNSSAWSDFLIFLNFPFRNNDFGRCFHGKSLERACNEKLETAATRIDTGRILMQAEIWVENYQKKTSKDVIKRCAFNDNLRVFSLPDGIRSV